MASTPQYFQIDEEIPHSTPIFRPAARRTPSYSSSSRSNSWDSSLESPPFFLTGDSPPFIPSPLSSSKESHSLGSKPPEFPEPLPSRAKGTLRPPSPPVAAGPAPKKPHSQEEISPKRHQAGSRLKRDPFFAALVECSKDDHVHDGDHGTNLWKGNFKITKSVSDRFGFINMYITSCKRTCAVSESIVYLPRARPHYLLHRHGH